MKRRESIAYVAGVFALAPHVARAQSVDKVTVALVAVENGAQAYFAKENGFFARAGIDAELQPLNNGGAIASAVVAGAVDIGFATVVPIALAHNRGLPLVFISAAYVSSDKLPTSALLVAPNSPIQKGADLNGKYIGTNGLATINEYVPRAWVDANGGDATTLRFVELPFSEMPSALAAGRVDAVYVAEPYTTAAKQNARVLFYGTAVTKDGSMLGGWFSTIAWARSHPDLVKRFDTVMRQSATWANANPAKSADVLAKYLKMDPKVAASINRTTFAEGLVAERMQQSVDLAAKYAKFRPFPASELIFTP